MAEPIGPAAGLLGLATFAFQSSQALLKTIRSYQTHNSRVRDLKEELEALVSVLGPLTETVSATTDTQLSALDLPLLSCGKACQEFEQEIARCTARTTVDRTSFRDWAKLTYMGDDIDGFRRRLGSYKTTVVIALTYTNM